MCIVKSALTVFSVITALALPAAAAEDAACKTVRFSDIGWTDIQATTTIANLVLKGLDYAPEVELLSIPITFSAMKSRKIDVFLGDWEPSLAADRKPYVDDGSIEVLGSNLKGAKYTLAVPTSLAEQGLRDFADIHKFRDQLDGKIYGIEAGNDGNRIIQSMISGNKFDLGDFELVESSEQGMLTQVDRFIGKKQAIVFLGWAPHPMNSRFDMTYLSGGDDFFGPNYGGATVYTNVRKGLTADCPNLGRFLSQLTFSLPLENEVMSEILDKGAEPADAARRWLVAHPDVLEPWLAGVTTFDGSDGLKAVRASLGL